MYPCIGDMYSADRRETVLAIIRFTRVATVRGLVAFATSFCGGVNLPEKPSLWIPQPRSPVLPGHNPGQRKHFHDFL